jgi:hypothetical protein
MTQFLPLWAYGACGALVGHHVCHKSRDEKVRGSAEDKAMPCIGKNLINAFWIELFSIDR